MRRKLTYLLSFALLVGTSGCDEFYEIVDEIKPKPPKSKNVITGLHAPIGIEADNKDQLWITESGTGKSLEGINDGQVSLITPDGQVYPVVQGFTSFVNDGAVVGLNNLLLRNGVLWILHGIEGRLYKLDITTFKPGDTPYHASDLKYEDLGTFIKNYEFTEDTNESNIYNLTIGPEGDFYIVDAAANAIIRREAETGKLSMFAFVPAVPYAGGELPGAQSVPTGITFDGDKFLVSTFTGFPFPQKQAPIYEFDLQGNVSVYQTGFTSATDIVLGTDRHPIVVEYSAFNNQTFTFTPNAGSLVFSSRQKNVPVLTNLNFPTSIERSGLKTYYIVYNTDGKIQKVNF
ncbi:ScyD/ScyE family protein [Adhaeribacter swui]|uniref:ScyD/ScyE family protein n=1 Tax=Adhaeribacter swui TaxID=2086471 RepID=A0A7G7GBW0_9BACT|nr:ScyD/ScyE family protein [Adhaeribacter swui]QNF34644.1 ScyD/ScyE family protein [Adhaeribacter swui]